MNTKIFSEALTEIDGSYLEKALTYQPVCMHQGKMASVQWLKWGIAAACVCLLAVGISTISRNNPDAGGNPVLAGGEGGALAPGGEFPEGIDPVIYSIAVYPPSEELGNVEDATANPIDEAAVLTTEPFCDHLPEWLPEGYRFSHASLYTTTMQNGTVYRAIRITYANGTYPEIQTVEMDGEVAQIAPNPNDWPDEFTLFLQDHQPCIDPRQKVYAPEEITEDVLHRLDHGTFLLDYGEVVIAFEPLSLEQDEILNIIRSIRQ